MPRLKSQIIANASKKQMFLYTTFYLELCATVLAIWTGSKLLTLLTPSCVGFRFLGITLILIGVALAFHVCITFIATVNMPEEGMIFQRMCCTMPLILVCVAFGIFALAVSSQGGGDTVPGKPYKEYHFKSYSKWMQNKVSSNANWDHYYKKAVVKNHVCANEDLNFKAGCCEPPRDCNFNRTSTRVWVKPVSNNYTNVDCNRWDNDPNTLCYDCQSCKAGFLRDVTSHWFKTGLWLVLLGTFLLLLISLNVMTYTPTEGSSGHYMSLA